MFNFVRLSDGGIIRQAGPRGEVKIICDIAARVLVPSAPSPGTSSKTTATSVR